MNKIAVVGSGPSGLFLSKNLLKKYKNNVTIDIYEKSNAPLGLLRYGVAPDHQEVKEKFMHHFEQIFKSPNIKFFTNVNVGHDISISKLSADYDVVILCTGMSNSKRKWLGFQNCFGSDEIFGWYNQNPEFMHRSPCLANTKRLVIVGNGNVALDMARMFAKNHSSTDKRSAINSSVLNVLKTSQVKEIFILGRRDIFHNSFSPSELRDFIVLREYCKISVQPSVFGTSQDSSRIQIKSVNILKELVQICDPENHVKEITFKFESPLKEILSDPNGTYLVSGSQEKTYFDMLIECIGFEQNQKFKEIPQGTDGKFLTNSGFNIRSNLYACGWSRTGPIGNIADSMGEALECSSQIVKDLSSHSTNNE